MVQSYNNGLAVFIPQLHIQSLDCARSMVQQESTSKHRSTAMQKTSSPRLMPMCSETGLILQSGDYIYGRQNKQLMNKEKGGKRKGGRRAKEKGGKRYVRKRMKDRWMMGSNLLVPVGKLHHDKQSGYHHHEVEEGIRVCDMFLLVVYHMHPLLITVIIIFSSLVLFLSYSGIRTTLVTAKNRVSL